jgi:hypothetical protein
MEGSTDLFGIPVPSTNKIFLTFVVIHIIIALVSVVSGLLAMLNEKTSRAHTRFGRIYYWSILAAFVTILILSAMRWPHNTHLLVIGLLTISFTYAGRTIAKGKRKNWSRRHTICMGFSYVFLLTGFYVDNGKNLPFWNQFPQWLFWIFPTIVGIPIILYVLIKHPLNQRN